VRDRRLGQLSGGTRRRVELAAGLVTSPDVVFLDEPSTGPRPPRPPHLWRLVTELAREDRTVVLTTQYLEEADQLADNVLVLDDGAVVAAGTPSEPEGQHRRPGHRRHAVEPRRRRPRRRAARRLVPDASPPTTTRRASSPTPPTPPTPSTSSPPSTASIYPSRSSP
jgi:ABC-2 type transport system ATP-binding protein